MTQELDSIIKNSP